MSTGGEDFVLLCHANPLQGGTMDHKVLLTAVRVLESMGLNAVRFNYRGVGQSSGVYGGIDGEIHDAQRVLAWSQKYGQCVATMGFSFGAFIAWRVRPSAPTLLIAPACGKMPFEQTSADRPMDGSMVLLPENDSVCDPHQSHQWAQKMGLESIWLPETGHFFHLRLGLLKSAISYFMTRII